MKRPAKTLSTNKRASVRRDVHLIRVNAPLAAWAGVAGWPLIRARCAATSMGFLYSATGLGFEVKGPSQGPG